MAEVHSAAIRVARAFKYASDGGWARASPTNARADIARVGGADTQSPRRARAHQKERPAPGHSRCHSCVLGAPSLCGGDRILSDAGSMVSDPHSPPPRRLHLSATAGDSATMQVLLPLVGLAALPVACAGRDHILHRVCKIEPRLVQGVQGQDRSARGSHGHELAWPR